MDPFKISFRSKFSMWTLHVQHGTFQRVLHLHSFNPSPRSIRPTVLCRSHDSFFFFSYPLSFLSPHIDPYKHSIAFGSFLSLLHNSTVFRLVYLDSYAVS